MFMIHVLQIQYVPVGELQFQTLPVPDLLHLSLGFNFWNTLLELKKKIFVNLNIWKSRWQLPDSTLKSPEYFTINTK